MCAASLVTSVPVIPIATPILARLSEGASLTPSPVMETNWSLSCSALTMLSFCSGDTRAYTRMSNTCFLNSLSLIFSNSLPVTTWCWSLSKMPISRAIVAAVSGWSPVIMTGTIPADLHSVMAFFASSLGGSMSPTNPKNVRSFSISSIVMSVGSLSSTLEA